MAKRVSSPQPYYENVIDADGENARQQRSSPAGLGWRLRAWDTRSSRQSEKTFWGTQREAERELEAMSREQAATAVPAVARAKSLTLEEWVETWLTGYAWKVPPARGYGGVRRPMSTWAKAKAVCDAYLLPSLGGRTRIARIDHQMLMDAIGGLQRVDGEPLAVASKATVAGVAKSLFRDAVRAGALRASPAVLLPMVWGDSVARRTALVPSILDAEKLAAALDEVWPLPRWARDLAGPQGEGRGDIVRLITYTGMRFEELAAVQHTALTRRYRLLTLAGDTASESGGRRDYRRGAGKSDAARRHLALVQQIGPVIDRLEAVRLRGASLETARDARRQVRQPRRQPNLPLEQRWSLLVCGEQGGFLSYSHWRKKLGLAREASGVNYSAHELRHVAASILIASGASAEEVREQMGHRNVKITEQVYRHLFRVDRSELARRISQKVAALTAAETAEAEADLAAEAASATNDTCG